jgi:hypothetical protein
MYARYAILHGYDPEATGDYYCNFLNDFLFLPEERALGLSLGQGRLEQCSWVLVVTDDRGISSGMQNDIGYAQSKGIELWTVRHETIVAWLKAYDPSFERWSRENFARAEALKTTESLS